MILQIIKASPTSRSNLAEGICTIIDLSGFSHPMHIVEKFLKGHGDEVLLY